MPRKKKTFHTTEYFLEEVHKEAIALKTPQERTMAYATGADVELTEAEKWRWQAYQMVWDDVTSFREKKHTVKRIERIFGAKIFPDIRNKWTEAHKIYTEATKIFTLAHPIDKDFERAANVQTLKRVASKAMEAGHFETARRCTMDAATLQGLLENDNLIPRDMAMGRHTDTVVTNLETLKAIEEEHEKMMNEDDEFTEFEEIE